MISSIHDGSGGEVKGLNEELKQEIESLNLIVKSLNEELVSADEVIKNLRNHSFQLKILVIEKQKIIELGKTVLNLLIWIGN